MSVRHALLALLSEGPKYGRQLQQEFEAGTGELWELNAGQVYMTLQRLERDGLVEDDEGDGDGPQRAFRLTETGATELDRWLRSPAEPVSPPRDELVIKVMVAMQVAGIAADEVVQDHRRQLIEAMQEYTALKRGAADDELSFVLVVDAQLFRLDAMIRWLDEVDGHLQAHPGPLPGPRPGSAAQQRRRRKAVER
jgi:DNA-binding PadR family transcriptional regulator